MLSRPVCDAVRTLGFLACARSPVLIADIARGTGLPQPTLAKLVSTLGRKGFVVTRRGIGGGAALARPAEAITLHDVCVALDDPVTRHRCLLGAIHEPGEGACPARALEAQQRQALLAFLRETTVRHVMVLARGTASA
jgi:Rrf2 family protein